MLEDSHQFATADASPGIVNAMSVDVEDWFQVGAFEGVIDRRQWDVLPHRVERNVHLVLDLFNEAGVKATFFTLGWIAARFPRLLRQIAQEGHELASHGWDHARVFAMDRARFAADISDARKAIEDAGGASVTGYRAPSFSMDARTHWAFEELAEQGYAYSSSVAPIAHDHYGWPDAPRFAFRPVSDAALLEIPVTTALLGRRRLGAGGGGFFRLLPYAFTRWAVRQVNEADRPAIFYFHPWEIDPDQPRVDRAPLRSRLRHYSNLARMEGKLRRLLAAFNWGRMDDMARVEALRAEPLPR